MFLRLCLRCRLASRRGFEPLLPPWKGDIWRFLEVKTKHLWGILVVDGTPWEPETWDKLGQIHALARRFFAVLADCLNAAAVGAPLLPGFLIRSGFLPAAFCALIRARFLAMFLYKPGRFITKPSAGYGHPCGHPFSF